MEKTIKILEVKFQPTQAGKDKWAVNTNNGYMSVWDRELAEFLIGKIGQDVNANCIFDKSGKYETIKNLITPLDIESQKVYDNYAKPTEKPKLNLMTQRDVQIISQCLTKCYYENKTAENPQEVIECYRFFVLELEQNG